MKTSSIIWGLLTAVLLVTGCSKDEKNDKKKQGDGQFVDQQLSQLTPAQRATLTVTDETGKAIVGAQVLIGTAANQPFAGNFLQTGAGGTFTAPAAWTSEQIVTIAAPGYIRASYLGQLPNGQSFQLRPAPLEQPLELQGNATGFTLKDNDDLMDFALIMPAVKKREMLAFNLDMFISPKTDRISIYGTPVDLPSNTSIPKQKERYGFIPVTLDKALYKLYFEQPGVQNVVTIAGQFPFNKVVGELKGGKSFIDVINYFNLKGGSLRDVNVVLPQQALNVPTTELTFNQARAMRGPNAAADEFLMAAALSPWKDQYFPTDFKNVPANSAFNLNTAAGADPMLLVALKKKAESNKVSGKLSAAFVPFTVGASPMLLPLFNNPTVASMTEFSVALPALPQGFREVGAYMTFSTVQSLGTTANGRENEKVTRLWEVYANAWMNHVTLPQWPGEKVPAGTKRWDVLLMANQAAGNNPVALGTRVFETVTHATHSATDF